MAKNDVTKKFKTDMTVGGVVKLGIQISNGNWRKLGDFDEGGGWWRRMLNINF